MNARNAVLHTKNCDMNNTKITTSFLYIYNDVYIKFKIVSKIVYITLK